MTAIALFLVLVANGHVSGTWGPLPYDLAECETRREEFQADLASHPETTDWVLTCEFHDARPELGEKRP